VGIRPSRLMLVRNVAAVLVNRMSEDNGAERTSALRAVKPLL
jgi:hypothetical protein